MTTLRSDRKPNRSRNPYNIFENGLEAVEIPLAAIDIELTPTAASLYQAMLLNSDRTSGRLHKAKVQNYVDWIGRDRTSIYNALAELNGKGMVVSTTHGYVKGTVLMRHQNRSKDDTADTPEKTLSRALVHRQALKIMIQHRLSGLTQRIYWELATQIDLQTGLIHTRHIDTLADRFSVSKAAIYKCIRMLNNAALTDIDVDFGVEGHLPHVSLAYGVIQFAVERKKEQAKEGRSVAQKYEHYRIALYRLFGVPIAALSKAEITKGIAALKAKLDERMPETPDQKQRLMHNLRL